MLLWGLVLVVASGYQSGFEYDTVGLAAGLSKSEYTSQIACSMVFNATAFAVVVLLDAMPTLAPLTKAGALLLFVGNAVRLWITDRFVLKTLLRPQVCVWFVIIVNLSIMQVILFAFYFLDFDNCYCFADVVFCVAFTSRLLYRHPAYESGGSFLGLHFSGTCLVFKYLPTRISYGPLDVSQLICRL